MTFVQAVVGSVILINRRQTTELFPPKLRNLWSEWQLRGLIFLSLTAQIVLVSLGNRRKYIAKTWIRAIVWFFYLLADSVATMAIGILSNNISEVYWKGNWSSQALEYELTAFWAPFLLLHMGGMDTITSYSLEDNELWLRHFFGVVAQAVTTLYVLLMSWSTSSILSPSFIVVFFVGLNKYCERVWALFSASENRFRDSIPEISTSKSKIVEECKLKLWEGYNVTTHQVLEVEVPDIEKSDTNSEDDNYEDSYEICIAYSFLDMVKRLFADLILSFPDRDSSRAFFESDQMKAAKAFKVIEIELGLMYDLIYTKAPVVYSYWGVAVRLIGSFLVLGVLVAVSLDRTLVGKKFSKIDLPITLVLLVVALLLDLCAFGELILSDQTAHWLIKKKKLGMLRIINHIRPMIPTNWCRERKRWSKTAKQFSLLSFCFDIRRKRSVCLKILKSLGIEKVVELYMFKNFNPPISVDVNGDEDLPFKLFQGVKNARSSAERYGQGQDLKSLYSRRGGLALEKCNLSEPLEWSVKLEFDQSILIWHLATEIHYQIDQDSPSYPPSLNKMYNRGNCMSQYMLYLLVEHPKMLPIGMGKIKISDLYSDLRDFIEEYSHKLSKDVTGEVDKEVANMLIQMGKENTMLVGRRESSTLVIFNGCKLASQLEELQDPEYKWQVIIDVWMEMLGHAASQCKGRQHAQQLRRGGEYLTHLWLLMAHLGFSDHFHLPGCRPIADIVLR